MMYNNLIFVYRSNNKTRQPFIVYYNLKGIYFCLNN